MNPNDRHTASQPSTTKPAQALRLDAFSRRHFLGCVGTTMAVGGLGMLAEFPAGAASARRVSGKPLPLGTALRVQPVLVCQLAVRHERTSWRGYGGLQSEG